MGNAVSTVLAIARAEIGYHEKASNAYLDDPSANLGSSNYTKFARDLDAIGWFYNGQKNGYAWCDISHDWFHVTAWGAEKALEVLCQPKYSAGAGCYYSAGYYKSAGRFYTSNPQAGDQIFFYSGGSINHTGIVESVSGDTVTTIEGNVSDRIERRFYSIYDSSIAGYGRPRYELVDDVTSPVGTIATPAAVANGRSVLKYGSKGADVEELQTKLIKLGYNCGADGADGDFGRNTSLAVQKFQRQKGLDVDSVVGAMTWAAIDSAIEGLCGTSSSPTTVTSAKTMSIKETEDMTWKYFVDVLGNEIGAAVMLGHALAESSFIAKNMQDSYEHSLGYTDDTYVAAVDSGEYTKFDNDGAGFGLFQLTYPTRKRGFLAYAKSRGKSIADPMTQLEYTYKELKESYSGVLQKLVSATSILDASNYVLKWYENPADQSDGVKQTRAGYAQKYYDRYSGVSTPATSTPASTWTPKVGDTVNYKGTTHYVRSDGGVASSCAGGLAKITNIVSGAAHPYHLLRVIGKGATVYGWVDAGTFEEA